MEYKTAVDHRKVTAITQAIVGLGSFQNAQVI
jgi:hypothetical protein